jgi:hypothetical protein
MLLEDRNASVADLGRGRSPAGSPVSVPNGDAALGTLVAVGVGSSPKGVSTSFVVGVGTAGGSHSRAVA